MNKYDKEYLDKQIESYHFLQKKYSEAINKILAGIPLSSLPADHQFAFEKYPKIKRFVNDEISKLSSTILLFVNSSTRGVWDLANAKNTAMLEYQFEKRGLDIPTGMKSKGISNYNNLSKQETKGFTISDRVWKCGESLRAELENSINAGLEEGKSANELARDIKKYLNNPDARFRRVRDKFGLLKPSQKALQYNPGRGVYRSSFMNALRLTRNEINKFYRNGDWERWQAMPFVVGYRIQNSNSRVSTICEVCKRFNGIVFPKAIKFEGFHVQCMCTAIPVFCTDEEFEKISNGEHIIPKRPPVPEEYKSYVKEKDHTIINKTKENISEFDNLSKTIAKRNNVTVTNVNEKSVNRIIEKARNNYAGDISRVKDIIRNTFIADKSKHHLIINDISKSFNVDRIKRQFASSDPLGYSGTIVNVKFKNGTFAEIQVNTPQMIYAKDLHSAPIIGRSMFDKIKRKSGLSPGLGHKYYEEWRTLKESNLGDFKKMVEIENASREYYNSLRKVKL